MTQFILATFSELMDIDDTTFWGPIIEFFFFFYRYHGRGSK